MKTILLLVSSVALMASAYAATVKEWDGNYSDYKLNYMMYSGDLGEHAAPKPNDKKLSFLVKGELAKEIFDSLGPDLKNACGMTGGVRIRERGDVGCSHHRGMKDPYTCLFGLNLKNGKSIPGGTC